MEIRDEFAIRIMAAMWIDYAIHDVPTPTYRVMGDDAYEAADAMLAARGEDKSDG